MNFGMKRQIMTIRAVWLGLCAALALSAVPVQAAPVTKILNNGPSGNRIDIAILGDGYTSSEMAKFAADASSFASVFLNEQPLKSWKTSFNAIRVDTPSLQSGAGQGAGINTVYGAYYNCGGVQRLLCVDASKVTAVLNANLAANQHDIVIVLVNDAEYGGSGGAFAVASTHALSSEVAIHEIGHSFGHLDDEYVDQGLCGVYTNPWGFNVSNTGTRTGVPWKAWIKPTTSVPTSVGSLEVGAFEGAFYCANGWFRPTTDSIMRTLGTGFRQVNSEALVRRIYENLRLYDSRKPNAKSVAIAAGTPVTFKVNLANTGGATLSVTWRLNGVIIGTGSSVSVSRAMLNGGTRTLKATIRAKTPTVRSDPNNLLIDTVHWTVSPS